MVQTGSQLGQYRLLRRIGAGGMAEVFLAQRIGAEGFARTVAIKTILAVGAEEEGIGLFLDEARVAGYLEHAAIVQTVDLGFENETLFIVMEYIAGPALSRIIRDLKKMGRFLQPEVVAYIGARVASALDYAHRRAATPDGKPLELVHRDISPQNIMLTRNGMVKLTDFGVARASVQTHKTRTGQVRGKAAYMAPEQVRAGKLDGRTDVFALALVLYEALTSVRAYQRKTDIMSMRAILTDEVQPIKEANPAVPQDLIDVVMKAMSKKPNDRFSNAAEMADALMATYRSQSETMIESQITNVINELFGPEQFSTDAEGLPVEAWQPTISAKAEGEGSNPTPHRISGSKLSPKIAAMLAPQPMNPPSGSSSGIVERVNPMDVQTPSSGSTPISLTPSMPSSSVAYAGIANASTGQGDMSLPGHPVMGQTNARPPPGYAVQQQQTQAGVLAPDPMAFNELAYAPVQQKTPSSSTSAVIVTSPTAARARGRMMIWASVALGSTIVIASAVLAVARSNANKESTKPGIEASSEPTASGGGVRVEAKSKPIEATATTKSIEPVKQPDPIVVAQPPPPDKDRERPAKKQKAIEHQAPPPKREDPPATAETKPKPGGAEAFVPRLLAARRKTKDPDLQNALTKLLNDLTISKREITKADEELVRKAEQ